MNNNTKSKIQTIFGSVGVFLGITLLYMSTTQFEWVPITGGIMLFSIFGTATSFFMAIQRWMIGYEKEVINQ